MTENRLKDELSIFTIGHSNHELEKFIHLLKSNKIDVLVDVRSNPYSRFASHFNKDDIKRTVQANGIKYLFLGKELGGQPEGQEFYDKDGYVLYSRIAESALFIEAINRLMNGITAYRVTLMCSEENPANCHRMLLVSRVLENRGIAVFHIRGDGRLQSKDEVSREYERVKSNEAQQSLFKAKEAREWKSTQSVLPKRALKNSLMP
ncbi:MAG: DUF488 domain-containing protein [Deltaproteobacteria bacterium]|nr:DUF488 domain-containing protein [Deltaproteobacteria bacterium]MBW1909078.1 DUF488 domain-containing protein [Deltaproteobacteria bacterium]MBW2034515.1 DUF488 domain-containing protein [Deltaproteobacteria bacterium]MBW2114825.1 DUF488 domain-containing protein [Deltaproteobacteria bacterium]MBW2168939.1 DUF488 domain-containing protein [Deltaproteobacteria bacterium]